MMCDWCVVLAAAETASLSRCTQSSADLRHCAADALIWEFCRRIRHSRYWQWLCICMATACPLNMCGHAVAIHGSISHPYSFRLLFFTLRSDQQLQQWRATPRCRAAVGRVELPVLLLPRQSAQCTDAMLCALFRSRICSIKLEVSPPARLQWPKQLTKRPLSDRTPQ
jgi:hypothetical protein